MPEINNNLELAMLHELMEEIRHVRRRLDEHIDDEKVVLTNLQSQVGKIREEMAGHKARISTIASLVSVVIAGVISWVVSHYQGKA